MTSHNFNRLFCKQLGLTMRPETLQVQKDYENFNPYVINYFTEVTTERILQSSKLYNFKMMKFLLVYAGTENLSKFAREKCET